jgi:hypothetical protein
VLERTIIRCSGFMRHSSAISSEASQSSSGGFVGSTPFSPKLSTVGTSASPKCRSQM